MGHRTLRLLGLALLLGLATTATAQTRFRVGHEVQFEFLGDEMMGTIIDMSENGWCIVEFERKGKRKEWRFPPSRLTLAGKSAPRVEFKTSGSPKTAEPGPTNGDDLAPSWNFDRVGRRAGAPTLELSPKTRWEYESVAAPAWTHVEPCGIELSHGGAMFSRPGTAFATVDERGTAIVATCASTTERADGIGIEHLRLTPQGLVSERHFSGPADRQVVATDRRGLLFALARFTATNQSIEIVRVENEQLVPTLRIDPREQRLSPRRPWAAIVGRDRVLTEALYTLELWDADGGRSIWSVETSPRSATFLDHTGAHAFVPQEKGTAIVRLDSSRCVGWLDKVFPTRDRVAVHPAGARVAWIEDKAIALMDLIEHAAPRERIALPDDVRSTRLAWIDEDHLLVGDELVVDVTHRTMVGRIETGSRMVLSCAHGALWASDRVASPRSNHVLTGWSVTAPPVRAGNILGVGGVEVRVTTDDRKLDKRLRKHFTKHLERVGVEVARASDVKLVVTASPAGTETRTYHSTLDDKKRTKTVHNTRWSVAIKHGGVTYWRTGGVWQDLPMVMAVREGQSIEDAARRQPSLGAVITDVDVPTFVGNQRLETIPSIVVPDLGDIAAMRTASHGDEPE